MIINNVKLVGTNEPVNIYINDRKVTKVSSLAISPNTETLQLTFDEAITFPGLINSHDHLDFNLFPQLGNNTYSNYTEWGKHIHQTYKEEIAEVLKIPVVLRAQWGIYKNLLCGVTTVINHGEKLGTAYDLINVFEETHCLHSVRFEKWWRVKLNNPFKSKLPVNIHVGEGTDAAANKEIDELTRWNILGRKIIGVHAVAMTANQAKKFDAIVWCPQSNYFLLNKTAPVNFFKNNTTLLFGTDSTLTSKWDIWSHLQSARETGLLCDKALYEAVTQNAAQTRLLNNGEIATGRDADIVIAKKNKDAEDFDAFYNISPADILMVMHKGNIRLFDESLLAQLQKTNLTGFSKIYINGVVKYIEGDLPGLMQSIRKYYPAANFPVCITNYA